MIARIVDRGLTQMKNHGLSGHEEVSSRDAPHTWQNKLPSRISASQVGQFIVWTLFTLDSRILAQILGIFTPENRTL